MSWSKSPERTMAQFSLNGIFRLKNKGQIPLNIRYTFVEHFTQYKVLLHGVNEYRTLLTLMIINGNQSTSNHKK